MAHRKLGSRSVFDLSSSDEDNDGSFEDMVFCDNEADYDDDDQVRSYALATAAQMAGGSATQKQPWSQRSLEVYRCSSGDGSDADDEEVTTKHERPQF